MQFAGGKGMFRFMFPDIPQPEKDAIVRTALKRGVNWFDTAEIYGFGRSERTLRTALDHNQVADSDVLIASKWWPAPRWAENIKRTFATRQKNLSGYTVDLYQIHQPLSFSSIGAQMNAMADLVDAGKIRAVGVSNFNAEQTYQAHEALVRRGYGLASNQVQFSLVDRQIETNGILDAAKELGVSIIAWSPIASGLLTGKFHRDRQILQNTPIGRRMRLSRQLEDTERIIAAMEQIAEKHNVSVAQVAVNWTINFHGETVVAIPGASKVSHAEEAAGAMDFRLSNEEMDTLDELTRKYR
jgi:aryl-alcohol dehydrogenase-like predicted oxidoreductase